MNQSELMSQGADEASHFKVDASTAVTDVFSAIAVALPREGMVTIAGFCTSSTRNRAAS